MRLHYLQKHSPITKSMNLKAATLLASISLGILSGCGVTARIEPYKETEAFLAEGERVVVLARKHHASHEAEEDFIDCVSDGLAGPYYDAGGLNVHNSTEFEDSLYPWFEPSMAPLTTDELAELLVPHESGQQPGKGHGRGHLPVSRSLHSAPFPFLLPFALPFP